MKIVILSHERSLNKTEAILKTFSGEEIHLIMDYYPQPGEKEYINLAHTHVIKSFNIVEIVKRIPKCDKIFTTSENLLIVQSQLESYYGIQNLTPYAAKVLSNKQLFDDHCKMVGLEDFIPNSKIVTFPDQLKQFGNKPIFTKPDIGTGGISLMQTDEHEDFNIEYRSWNNRHHFLDYIKEKDFHSKFFELNKAGIPLARYNYEPGRIMFQEYMPSDGPSIAPCGLIKDGKLKILYYLKNEKTQRGKYVQRDRCVWTLDKNEINKKWISQINYFMEAIVEDLGIKELFFAGPDFHLVNDKLIAIDFNPRLGQFSNVINNLNKDFLYNGYNGVEQNIKHVLWQCAELKPGLVKSVDEEKLSRIKQYINSENHELKAGITIPNFPNLQNRKFSYNLNIIGDTEKQLVATFKKVNQLLQDCIEYVT
jgi:hypothetical protein